MQNKKVDDMSFLLKISSLSVAHITGDDIVIGNESHLQKDESFSSQEEVYYMGSEHFIKLWLVMDPH